MNATDLLTAFRGSRSEEAFAELVRRYTNLVFSAANRRLSNSSLAQEATQLVFIRLANGAPKLRTEAELTAWLHRTTLHVSIDLWRSESRRRAREEHVAAMQTECDEPSAWKELAPVVDEALNELNDADRQAILLRFFNHKTMRELGCAFEISEDAAKMRVSRALERLRRHLSARGVACHTIVLGTLLSERAVEAAPAQLGATLAGLKIAAPAGMGSAAGMLALMMQVSKVKLVSGIAAAVLAGAGAFSWLRSGGEEISADDFRQGTLLVNEFSSEQELEGLAPTPQPHDLASEAGDPDPVALLQGVARARQRIASGEMQFTITHHYLDRGRPEINEKRVAAVFEGGKRRVESVGREYHYVGTGADLEQAKATIQELGLNREEAIRAGFIRPFEARIVTAYDGLLLLSYRETDGESDGTDIRDPAKAGSDYAFDPRVLGLTSILFVMQTVESALDLGRAELVELVGMESVEGVAAWHVRVTLPDSMKCEFWIDATNPSRVVKQEFNGNTVVSTYDPANPNDPIPTQVHSVSFHGPEKRRSETRFLRESARFNVPVDPASWTLAGLGMPVGTSVADSRIMRRIGYWTGTGLSENLPRKSDQEPESPPGLNELLALLEHNPESHAAFEAAEWILLNTPDGDAVEKAAEVILRDHIQSPELIRLAKELERVRHRSARQLLEAMMEKNPDPDIRATACFTLATLLKDDANHGRNKEATVQAEKLFERLMTEFSQTAKNGLELARRAKPELYELRYLTLGNPAPEIEGEDLDGRKMKLSDHRGKVVVLSFWSVHYSEAPQHHRLIESMKEKPFALIGVNCDHNLERAKATVEQYEITWPSFRDGRSGPIAATWNTSGSIFVLDRAGIIRHRGLREPELLKAVEALLLE
jgi:RNA polymerase sigma factor (sigma-70 family)